MSPVHDKSRAVDGRGPIRVAVVEDDAEYLDDLCALLKASPATALAGRFVTGAAALEAIPRLQPDVVLIDLDLGQPHMTGIDLMRHLAKEEMKTEYLVLTHYDDDLSLFAAIEAGAVGYIVKDRVAAAAGLIAAVEEVVQGGAPMSLGIARRVLARLRRGGERPSPHGLTKRECEVLERLAKGYHTKKVAEMLNISYGTVRCHQKNIYKKLHVNSLMEAVTVFREL